MASKSLVYLDDTIQKYMKDILIPVIGFRDVSKPLGYYTSVIESLKKDLTALQVPDKTKIYRLNSDEITAYVSTPNEYPAVCSVELKHGSGSCVVTIGFPSNLSYGNDKPYIVGCNDLAKELLKTVKVEVMNAMKEPSNVFKVSFPNISDSNVREFSGGYLTVYSEDRNVIGVKNWEDGVTPTVGLTSELKIGVTSNQDAVPNIDKLVYSENIRNVLGITRAYQRYLLDTQQTVASTLYVTREDSQSKSVGDIFMKESGDVKKYYANLVNIFGKDWSNLNIIFEDSVYNIDGAFSELDITVAPNSIQGKNIASAKNLFLNSNVTSIPNQSEFLSGMPNLSILDGFMKGTKLNIAIDNSIILSNRRLTSIEEGFANTKITHAPDLWNLTNETEYGQTLHISGKGCFSGVTTLDNLDEVPEYWKVMDNRYIYKTMNEFNQFREIVLAKYNNNLSTIIIEFKPEGENIVELDNIYSSSSITHTPLKIVSPGAKSIYGGFGYCQDLISVSGTVISEIPTLENIGGLLQSCGALTSLPTNLISSNKSIKDYSYAFAELNSITGETPKAANGKAIWELAGTEGYPDEIIGSGCFSNSTFDDIDTVPSEWK